MTRIAAKLLVRTGERLLAAALALASAGVPRSPRLWAFGSSYGQRFADNPKHFFLYCHSLPASPVRAVWISRSRAVIRAVRALGLPAYHQLSPRGIWYALRAGVYIVDCRVMDVSPVAGRGALTVNLWHGVPLKKIERDIEQPHHPISRARNGSLLWRSVNRVLRPQLTEEYGLILATSPAAAERLGGAFGVPPERVLTAGYPRTDPLLAPRDAAERFLTAEERQIVGELDAHGRAGRRVLLYMPTFRDWNNSADRRIPIDWAALDAALAARGGVLYCKLHPSDRTALPPLGHLAHVRVLPNGVDVYPLLAHTDALVTDYSSIFFDYLLLDRPLLFFPYDLAEYQQLSRTLYDPYEAVTPGPKAYTAQELAGLVARLLDGDPAVAEGWRAERARVRSRFYRFVDARASERLLAELLARLEGGRGLS